jgi:hypothetical protein
LQGLIIAIFFWVLAVQYFKSLDFFIIQIFPKPQNGFATAFWVLSVHCFKSFDFFKIEIFSKPLSGFATAFRLACFCRV